MYRQKPPYRFLWLTYHSWVLLKQKAIYFSVPKNACTSLKRLMCRIEGREPPEGIHLGQAGRHLAYSPPSEILEMIMSPDWFRFCFVRNPYDRLLSAYKSKIGLPKIKEDRFLPVDEQIRRHFGYPETGHVISFQDFVSWIARDESQWDDHWEMQTRTLRTDVVSYSFIGRFESIERDLVEVFGRIGVVPIPLEKVNVTPQTSGVVSYNQELADIVYGLYKPDFDAFGYAKDSWKGI